MKDGSWREIRFAWGRKCIYSFSFFFFFSSFSVTDTQVPPGTEGVWRKKKEKRRNEMRWCLVKMDLKWKREKKRVKMKDNEIRWNEQGEEEDKKKKEKGRKILREIVKWKRKWKISKEGKKERSRSNLIKFREEDWSFLLFFSSFLLV